MNTEAGGKLWNRKPSAAPAVSAASTPAPAMCRSNAMIANATPSIVHSPAASPSTPSEKFTTFIRPTSQITVRTPPVFGSASVPTNGNVTSVTTAPASTAITAAAICPSSFHCGLRGWESSIAPTSVIRHAPPRIARVWTVPADPGAVPTVWWRLIVLGSQNADATSTPARIASPPRAGVSRSASPRSLGVTTAPTRRASLPANGVSTAATAIATRNANKASQYRMPFGKHGRGGGLVSDAAPERLCDPGRDGDRLVRELAVGDPHDAEPVRDQDLVAFAVVLEREPVAVGAPAVKFDDQAV